MSVMEIVLEGDPILREKATRIRRVDQSIEVLALDMIDTMLDAPGVGLAAPQVGYGLRLIVVYLLEDDDDDPDDEQEALSRIKVLLNPEIIRAKGREVGPEGCLSIPGWVGDVPRSTQVTVKAMDLRQREIRLKLNGYPARIIQHEIDHLDGILYVDRVEDRETLRRVSHPDVVDPEVEAATLTMD